jgi:hypothetical protein
MAAAVGASHLLGDWKNWFAGVFALFNSTDAPLYCKNDLVSSQNALSTEDLIFVPCECGDKISHLRHTMGEKM